MTAVRVWLARLAGLFRRTARDRALDAEMRAHLEDLTDDLIDRGLSRAEAEAAARRAFGGVEQVKDACRDQRGLPLIDALAHDVRMARRGIAIRPGSTMLIVAGLGLGIGVSMALFTIVNAICLRGLPIPDPDRVLFLSTRTQDGRALGVSYPDFAGLRQATRAFEGLAAFMSAPLSLADEGDAPVRVAGCYVSASAFPMLGATPAAGRALQPDDDRPGAPLTAVIGDAVWASRYGRDPSVVGRAIRVNGVTATVVGIMPDGFRFPGQADLWLPLSAMPGLSEAPRTDRSLAVFGRLRDEVEPLEAQAEVQAAARRLDAEFPSGDDEIRFESVPINDRFNGRITDPEWLAFLTAGLLVLLVACANVANVLLARLAARSREVAVRLALGATRARVVRQLLIESASLAALGGVAGLMLAFAAVRLLAWSYPASSPLPYWIGFTIDGRVLTALVATCAVSVLIVGLVPALQGTRIGVGGVLKDGGRQTSGVGRARFWTAAFLAIEFALTLVLLANVSMAVRQELVDDQPGIEIDPAPLLVAGLTLPPQRYATAADRSRFYDRLRAEIAGVGTVASMTSAARMPPGHDRRSVTLPDRPPGETEVLAYSTSVGPRFFETLGVPRVVGRDLTLEDERPGHEGVVVNERFIEMFFAGQPPVGQRIAIGDAGGVSAAPIWRTIVGVIPNLRDGDVPEPIAYVPDQDGAESTTLVLRTTGDPAAVGRVLRQAVAALDRDLPLDRVAPLSDAMHDASWNGRISASLLIAITTIAFMLAAVGLYAVLAHSVTQRTPEIGIRMALGASARAVVWLVLRRAFAYAAVGLVVSLPCTYLFERIFVTATSGEHPLLTPVTFVPVVVLLAAVTLVATAGPAARAARIAPVTALRQD